MMQLPSRIEVALPIDCEPAWAYPRRAVFDRLAYVLQRAFPGTNVGVVPTPSGAPQVHVEGDLPDGEHTTAARKVVAFIWKKMCVVEQSA